MQSEGWQQGEDWELQTVASGAETLVCTERGVVAGTLEGPPDSGRSGSETQCVVCSDCSGVAAWRRVDRTLRQTLSDLR